MGEGHVHVCMCPCGHMCDVCQIAHVEVRGLPRLLAFTVHLALTQSPAVPCCVDQVSWPMSFWEFSSLHVPSCHRSNGIIDTRYCVPFFGWFVFNVGPSDPNSGLYVRRVLHSLSILSAPEIILTALRSLVQSTSRAQH